MILFVKYIRATNDLAYSLEVSSSKQKKSFVKLATEHLLIKSSLLKGAAIVRDSGWNSQNSLRTSYDRYFARGALSQKGS
jgi:hypothetical protein